MKKNSASKQSVGSFACQTQMLCSEVILSKVRIEKLVY